MAATLGEFARNGWLNIVGGCCGTTPAHIRAIAAAVAALPPRRRRQPEPLTRLSGLEPLVLRPESNFMMIGERTNVTGSKKFSRLILNGQFEQGGGGRPRAGRKRREHRRRQHGRRHARRRRGHDPVPQPGRHRNRRGRSPADGRQLEMVGHRGRTEVRAGQVDRQLDQPQGRRGGIPAPRAAGAPLRRRGRGDGLRRTGTGRRGRRQSAHLPAAPTGC